MLLLLLLLLLCSVCLWQLTCSETGLLLYLYLRLRPRPRSRPRPRLGLCPCRQTLPMESQAWLYLEQALGQLRGETRESSAFHGLGAEARYAPN